MLLPLLSPLGQMHLPLYLSPLLDRLSDPLLLVLALVLIASYTDLDHDLDMEGMLLGQWGSKQTRNLPWSHKPNQTKNYPPNRSQKLGRALIGLFVWKNDQNREKRDRLTTPHIQSPLSQDPTQS